MSKIKIYEETNKAIVTQLNETSSRFANLKTTEVTTIRRVLEEEKNKLKSLLESCCEPCWYNKEDSPTLKNTRIIYLKLLGGLNDSYKRLTDWSKCNLETYQLVLLPDIIAKEIKATLQPTWELQEATQKES